MGYESEQAYAALVLPFEFVVIGTPVSQQTANRSRLQAWKAQIRAAAALRWPSAITPMEGPVRLKVTYYYLGEPLDTDNMIKPIQDALIGVAYADDRQVLDVHAHKRSLEGTFRLRGLSPILAEGFVSGSEFLHVVLEPPADPEVLP